MKRIIVYLMVFALLCFLSNHFINTCLARESQSHSPYYLAFASTGANLLELRFDSWAKIRINSTLEDLDFEDMDAVIQEHLSLIKLSIDPAQIRHHSEENHLQASYQLHADHAVYKMAVQGSANSTAIVWFSLSSTNKDKNWLNKVNKSYQEKNYSWMQSYKGEISLPTSSDSRRHLADAIVNYLQVLDPIYQESEDSLLLEGKCLAQDGKIHEIRLEISCHRAAQATTLILTVLNDQPGSLSLIKGGGDYDWA